MTAQSLTVVGSDGAHTFDIASIFQEAKSAIKADYSDDKAVAQAIALHGDLAERDFVTALEKLNLARCAEVSGAAIEKSISAQARMSLVLTCLSWARKSKGSAA